MYHGHNISKNIIVNIVKKASNALNFIKRNLSDGSSNVKASAYLMMVCPQIECAFVIWGPYYNNDGDKLDLIQRRAARWVFSH